MAKGTVKHRRARETRQRERGTRVKNAAAMPTRVTAFAPEVASLLGRTEKTLRSDMSRRPESVPPWFKFPATKTPVWVRQRVLEFILEHAEAQGAGPSPRVTTPDASPDSAEDRGEPDESSSAHRQT